MSNQNLPDKAGVVIFPPLLYVLTLVAASLAVYLFPWQPFPAVLRLGGWPLLAAGFALMAAAVNQLNRHLTTVNPRGETTTIVKTGVFRFSRNPMYISFNLIYLAVLLLTSNWIGFLLLAPLLAIVRKGVIEREEKYLVRKFGDDYLQYQSSVRRWI